MAAVQDKIKDIISHYKADFDRVDKEFDNYIFN